MNKIIESDEEDAREYIEGKIILRIKKLIMMMMLAMMIREFGKDNRWSLVMVVV